MYFFRKKGKQILDLRGDLVLTHNASLVMSRVKSNGPRIARNARYVLLRSLGFFGKIKASYHAIRFIWGPDTSITLEELESNGNNDDS